MNRVIVSLISLILMTLGASGCSANAPPSSPTLSGGILVGFEVVGERYNAFITNPATIEQTLAIKRGDIPMSIPNAKLVAGKVSYNTLWSWHTDPQDISFADFTVEIYDGLPSHVENNLEYWLNTVGRFAPWQAKIVNIVDYR